MQFFTRVEILKFGKKDRSNQQNELTEHSGNVLAVISDLKLSTGFAKVKEAHDYYPFGMEMAGRSKVGEHPFGFQGQLKEDDIWGNAAASFFKYRISDNRIGRFLRLIQWL